MYNSFGKLPGFTAVKQNGLHVGVEDSYFSVVGLVVLADGNRQIYEYQMKCNSQTPILVWW
jgi:hypothetical protein